MTTFTDTPWDGSPSRWSSTDDYCRDCMIDENEPGKQKVQALCKLPYREPNGGAVNKGALRSIAGVLQGSMGGLKGVSMDAKRAAAKKCLALMKEAKMQIGDGLYRAAGEEPPK